MSIYQYDLHHLVLHWIDNHNTDMWYLLLTIKILCYNLADYIFVVSRLILSLFLTFIPQKIAAFSAVMLLDIANMIAVQNKAKSKQKNPSH